MIYVFAILSAVLQPVLATVTSLVEAGKVQIRTLLVGVIKPESPAAAAAILGDSDPAKKWHDYEQSLGKMTLDLPKTIPPTIMNVLKSNQTLMDELGANATPAIYYMNKDNVLQQEVDSLMKKN